MLFNLIRRIAAQSPLASAPLSLYNDISKLKRSLPMSNIEYLVAQPSDQEALVDFGNYVFSQAHVPHDFKTLLPKVYADHVVAAEAAKHFIARRDDGQLRAMVANRALNIRVLDETLHTGFIGTVSVHPYARGEGHMKRLMADMIDEARARGLDMLILGGLRQRYNYFGFEQAGIALCFTVTSTNLRHCLRDVDVSDIEFSELSKDCAEEFDFAVNLAASQPVLGERPREEFMDIMHTWTSRCRVVRANGQLIGLMMGSIGEILLTDESLLPRVLKALFALEKLEHVSLRVAPYETARIQVLESLAESRSIQTVDMVSVLNWLPVLRAYLNLKASYTRLVDGCVTLEIEGTSYTLRVEDGRPTVACEGRAPELVLDHMAAQRLFFNLDNAVCEHPLLRNWVPLPFFLASPDTF